MPGFTVFKEVQATERTMADVSGNRYSDYFVRSFDFDALPEAQYCF